MTFPRRDLGMNDFVPGIAGATRKMGAGTRGLSTDARGLDHATSTAALDVKCSGVWSWQTLRCRAMVFQRALS